MQLDDADYWRDGIAMPAWDEVNYQAMYDAACMCETCEGFNAAIWAASRLDEVVAWHYGICLE